MTGRPMPGAFVAGQVLDGKYKIVRHLADGGMGSVYEAEHLALGRHIAIKTLHPDLATNEDMVARLQKEARAASAIGHEHIVDIHDLGRSTDNTIFIVMELLRGENLADRLRSSGGVLPVGRAAHILKQVLQALGAAHAIGIIHRDLKPENIFLVNRHEDLDFVKVLDFGISKMLADAPDAKLTSTGFVLGTPYYMAPEQARGGQLDHRIDLYACGALLYHLVTGRVPFNAPNFNALMFEIAAGRYAPPRQIMPSIPPGFERIITWAMDLDPMRRLQSSEKFIQALSPFVQAPETPRRELPKSSMPTLVVESREAAQLIDAEQQSLPAADFDDRATKLHGFGGPGAIEQAPDTDPGPGLIGQIAAQVSHAPVVSPTPAPVGGAMAYHPAHARPGGYGAPQVPASFSPPHPASGVLEELAARGDDYDPYDGQPTWRRFVPLGIGLGAGLLVGLLIVMLVASGRSAAAPEPTTDHVSGLPPGVMPEPPRPIETTPTGPAGGGGAVALRTVKVTFKVLPADADAQIALDRKRISGRSATLAMAADATANVVVTAPGYQVWEADLALQDGQTVPVTLKKDGASATKPEPVTNPTPKPKPKPRPRPDAGKSGGEKKPGPGGSIEL